MLLNVCHVKFSHPQLIFINVEIKLNIQHCFLNISSLIILIYHTPRMGTICRFIVISVKFFNSSARILNLSISKIPKHSYFRFSLVVFFFFNLYQFSITNSFHTYYGLSSIVTCFIYFCNLNFETAV